MQSDTALEAGLGKPAKYLRLNPSHIRSQFTIAHNSILYIKIQQEIHMELTVLLISVLFFSLFFFVY